MMKKDKEHYSSVSFYRVCAMLMIFVGHFVNAHGIASVSQMLIVGVEMFLFLSGWLYGDKRIENPGIWLWHRLVKVCVPASLWSMIACLLYAVFCHSYSSISSIAVSLLNLQGLGRILDIPIVGVPQAHLWFVTVIMLCYLTVPCLERWTSRNITYKGVLLIAVLGGMVVALLCYAGIYLASLFCFFLGYFMKRGHVLIRGRSYWMLTVFTLGMSVFRLICRCYIDGTILYDDVITMYNRIVLAIWLFYSVSLLEENTGVVSRIANGKLFSALEKANYYIYLTHYIFAAGNLAVMQYIDFIPLQIVAYIALTALCTLFMYWLDGMVQGIMRKAEQNIGWVKE